MKVIIVMINLSIFFFFFSKNSDLRLYRIETVTLLSLKFFEFFLNNKYIFINLLRTGILTLKFDFFLTQYLCIKWKNMSRGVPDKIGGRYIDQSRLERKVQC